MRFLLTCGIATLCALLPFALQAGTYAPGQPGQCQLRLSGQIEAGDADALSARLGAFDFADGETSDQFLCLSSPGGSFSEALRIGQILIDKGIGTRIESGQACLSACAVTFMMGSQYFYEGVGNGQNANRHMHVMARLGFHRPELRLGRDGSFDTAALEKSFDVAIQATLDFVRLANEGSRNATMVPPDLIERMFTHKGDDYFLVETTGQTARWNIEVDGLDLPRQMSPEAAWNACTNIPVWASRYEADIPAFNPRAVRLLTGDAYGEIYEVNGPYEGDAPHYCLLQYTGAGGGPNALNGCGLLGMENQNVGEILCTGPEDTGSLSYITSDLRVFLPPATLLREARQKALQMAASVTEGAGGSGTTLDDFRAGCATNGGRAFVTNVTSFTNLRRQATIGSDKLLQVPLGDQVAIVRPGVVPDVGGISARCRDLCRRAPTGGLSGRQKQALNACFDANAFWYRVQTRSGRMGFLSGKFLRR